MSVKESIKKLAEALVKDNPGRTSSDKAWNSCLFEFREEFHAARAALTAADTKAEPAASKVK